MTDDRLENAEQLRKDRLELEQDDLYNDMSGTEVGRITRVVTQNNPAIKQKNERDNDLLNILSDELEAQTRKLIKSLNDQFELNQLAIDNAKKGLDEELRLANEKRERIQENATLLDDGRRVYIDEQDGLFYDESGAKLDDAAQAEAQDKHQEGNSTKQQFDNANDRIERLQRERQEIEEFERKQDELKQRLIDHPEQAADIQEELNNLVIPDRVLQQREALNKTQEHVVRNAVSTSAAKLIDEDSALESELALMPSFSAAVNPNQPQQENTAAPETPRHTTRVTSDYTV